MTADTRIPQPPGTRGTLKASKPLASSVLASAPVKHHLPVPKLKSSKGTVATSPPSSSSSGSSSGKKANGGKAIANRKISQGTAKDAATVLSSESAVETAGTALIPQGTKSTPAAARLSTSEDRAETKTVTEFESLNEMSFAYVEPDETKRVITDIAEPSLQIPGLELKNVVHSNLVASSWFTLDDHEFDDFFKDRNSHMTSSEKYNTISDVALKATAPPNATPESINDDEFGGAIGGVCSNNKPLQQENCEDGKIVLEELTNLETEDESEGKDDSHNGCTMPKKSETKGVVKQAFDNLMCEAGHGISAAWSGSRRGMKFLLPMSVLILYTVLWCVEKLTEDELDMLPPPT